MSRGLVGRGATRALLPFAVAAICFCFFTSSDVAYAQTKSDARDIWTQPTLTGDWGGLRSHLERNGVTFSLDYTVELLANLHGGIRRGAVVNGLFQPQLDIDTEKLFGWQGGRFRASGIITHGPGLTPGFVGNFATVSNIEAGAQRLYELWYEQSFLNSLLTVRAGLLTIDNFGEITSVLMNNTFGWNTLVSLDLPAGGPAYPLSAPGVGLRIKPAEELYLAAVVFSGDPIGGDGSNRSVELPRETVISFRGGALFAGEFGYTPNQEKDAKGLPGKYKVGGWYHTSPRFGDQRFDTLGLSLANPLSNGIPQDHSGMWGLFAVANQMLFREAGKTDQGLAGFVRVFGAPGDRNLIDFYVDAGFLYTGLIPGRPDDKLGVGVAYARVGDHARQLDRDIAFFTASPYPIRSAETVVEASYRAVLAPWWSVQGDVQYIIRPSGGVLNDDGTLRKNAWVVGMRTALSF